MAERTVDIVLRGGTVVDGTGQPPFRADVAIDKGLIVGVEEDGSPGDGGGRGGAGPWRGRREIDCRGKTIAPGFVDLHTHYGPTPTPLPPSCSRPSPSPHPIPRPHHPVSHLHPALSSGGGRRRADDVGSVPLALERRRRHHSDRRKLRRRLCRALANSLFTVLAPADRRRRCAASQPCRTEDRRFLVQLMEGVEEIPAHALEEGTDWDWESFPDYLDALGETSPATAHSRTT